MMNTTFDILAGRLSLDVTGFLRGLQTASQAAERFVGNMSGFAASMRESTAAVNGLSAAVGQSFQRAKVELEEFAKDSNVRQWFGFGATGPGRQFLPMMNRFGASGMGGMSGPLGFLQRMFMAASSGTGIGAALSGTQDVQNLINQHEQAGDALGAINLQIQNIQARLAQSKFNLQQLSNEPLAGGGLGGFPGVDNSAYFLTRDTPLSWEIKSLTATLNQLLAQRQKLQAATRQPPKLAAGGLVTDPTYALIGESGPEAVLPLANFGQWFSRAMGAFGSAIGSALGTGMGYLGQIIPIGTLNSMFGNPMALFGNQGAFPINPGGFGVNPLGLNMANLGAFDSMFGAASAILNRQADLGNTGALGLLAQWSKVQQTAEDALGFLYQHRRIDLGGHSGYGASGRGPLFGESTHGQPFGYGGYPQAGGHQFSLNMYVNGALQQSQIGQVFDWFETEARRRGADGLGRSALRSRPFGQMLRGPLTPAGLAQ